MKACAAALLFPLGAMACPNDAQPHFSCMLGDGKKVLEICYLTDHATYSFGPPGAPELFLNRHVTDVALIPWPGIGRTIWEEVAFTNDDHTYTVYAAIERVFPENEEDDIQTDVTGGVIVTKDGTELARLGCDPGTVDFPWGTGLFDAKIRNGQCYDQGARQWAPCG